MMGDVPIDDPSVARFADMGPDKIAPLAVFLASDAARDVSNQVFGVRGDEICLFSKPRPMLSQAHDGGWSAQAIADELLPVLLPVMPRADEVAADVFPMPNG